MAATDSSRDLYCVLECDRVHKARTVVRTGDLVFDWDETFELDLLSNKELDFLIYYRGTNSTGTSCATKGPYTWHRWSETVPCISWR